MIKYTWKILSIDKTNIEGINNVIQIVNWSLEATDGKHIAKEKGSLELSAPNPDSFIDFKLLTKQNIVSWLESNLDTKALKGTLNSRIKQLQDNS